MLSWSPRLWQAMFFEVAIVLAFCPLTREAQDKPVQAPALKTGFLMDSLKIERWQTDLDAFQKRAEVAPVVSNRRVLCGYCNPQNVASGFTNSNPASHASWLRQTTSASALRPVSC